MWRERGTDLVGPVLGTPRDLGLALVWRPGLEEGGQGRAVAQSQVNRPHFCHSKLLVFILLYLRLNF